MGLGSQEIRKPTIYLNIKAQSMDGKRKFDDPHFEVSQKVDGKITPRTREDRVSGYLAKIGSKKYVWEGKNLVSIYVILLEGDTQFKIEASPGGSLGRSLMNSIMAIDNWEYVTISLYMNKKGEKPFPSIWVANNDKPMGWKYDYNTEIKPLVYQMQDPQAEEGVMMNVYKKVESKLLAEWEKTEAVVLKNAKTNPTIKALVDPIKAQEKTAPVQNETLDPKKELFGEDAPGDGPPEDEDERNFPPPPPNNDMSDDLPF